MVRTGFYKLIDFADDSTVAHWYNADTLTASPSQINFLIFVPIFSFLSIAYLEVTPRFLAKGKAHRSRYIHQKGAQESRLTLIASHPYAHFAFEVVNMLFYFAGFVALATFLGKLLFCRGSVCAAARADAVFAAFSKHNRGAKASHSRQFPE